MPKLDTLVFSLFENDRDKETGLCSRNNTDIKLYVLYDFERRLYAIYGSREQELPQSFGSDINGKIVPFHFLIERKNDVFDFINNIVDKTNEFTIGLHAVKDVPILMDEINYTVLDKLVRKHREIAQFDFFSFPEDKIHSYLSSIRNVFTMYEFEEDIYVDDEDE